MTDCCELPYYIVFLPHKSNITNYTQTSMLVGNLIKSTKFVFWEVQRFLIFEICRLATLVDHIQAMLSNITLNLLSPFFKILSKYAAVCNQKQK